VIRHRSRRPQVTASRAACPGGTPAGIEPQKSHRAERFAAAGPRAAISGEGPPNPRLDGADQWRKAERDSREVAAHPGRHPENQLARTLFGPQSLDEGSARTDVAITLRRPAIARMKCDRSRSDRFVGPGNANLHHPRLQRRNARRPAGPRRVSPVPRLYGGQTRCYRRRRLLPRFYPGFKINALQDLVTRRGETSLPRFGRFPPSPRWLCGPFPSPTHSA